MNTHTVIEGKLYVQSDLKGPKKVYCPFENHNWEYRRINIPIFDLKWRYTYDYEIMKIAAWQVFLYKDRPGIRNNRSVVFQKYLH